jgi:hypothetical protein
LANAIELASAQESYRISTSFELLFDNYDIAIGVNGNKDALVAKIIREGDVDFAKYDGLLRCNGGSGKEGDDIIFRILKGDIIPAGAGIVAKPASGIKGILSVSADDVVEENKQTEESFVKTEENCVNATTIPLTNMKIELKSIEDVVSKWDELVKNEAAASSQSIGELIASKIAERSAEYGKELAEKEAIAAEAKAAYEDAQNKIKELAECVSNLTQKLKEIEDCQAAADAEAKFNARMSEVDDTFDLDEDDRAMLCEEVKAADSDESYSSWLEKKKKLLKEKTRAYKQKQAEALKEKFSKANVNVKFDDKLNVEEVFASITPVAGEPTIPNSSESSENIKAKMLSAFGDGIEVNGVTAKKFLEKK